LTRAGFQVLECPDGNILMKRMTDTAPFRASDSFRPADGFDLIISDIRMPGMTGLEVLEAAREQGIKSPMILISAFSNRETEALAETLGAAALLPKPFDMEELLRKVRQLMPLDRPAAPHTSRAEDDGESLPFPLEITFRHHFGTEPVRTFIKKMARRLARFDGNIARCRVVIDSLRHGEGLRHQYRVHLYLASKGRPIVVQHNATDGDENLYLALHHAFTAAERVLKQNRRVSWRKS
jgi:CheY-like chemotaxis protein/ribosome-associated translation inhibitor RaiA